MNKAINCMFIILAFVMCISCGSYNTATMYADADTISIDGATRCDSLIFSDFIKAPKVVLLETKPECVVHVWQSVLNEFAQRHAVAGLKFQLNDMGATQAVVNLRLSQAISMFKGV